MVRKNKRSFFARLRRWLLWLSVLWLVITFSMVLFLRWFNPPTTAFMLQRLYSDEFGPVRLQHEWRDFSQIAPSLALSVIASEDQKFAEHWGFDVDAIQQVLEKRQAGKSMRGASTISQQLAKNIFLWPSRSWLRKGLEVYFTGAIELMIPKRRILELYLNVVEFGDGIYGAESAAQAIFSLPAIALSREQAALLAARLPAPKRYQINPPTDYMRERAAWIMEQTKQLGEAAYLKRL
ncbi:MAG: monofunctional biosynthetic peptidoglycan transglycosylase [Marinicella sp.]